MKCRNCVNLECGWCDMKADSPDPDIERECHWFAQKTNADIIRSMSDEELAEVLHGAGPGGLWGDDISADVEDWLDWLRKEADHD